MPDLAERPTVRDALRPCISALGFAAAPTVFEDVLGVLHPAVRSIGGEIVRALPASAHQSFRVVAFRKKHGERAAFLVHASSPLVATVRGDFDSDDYMEASFRFYDDLDFVRIEWLRAVLVPEVVLTTSLEDPEVKSLLAMLTPFEREDFRYWNPTLVGEVVFNFWD